jgi:hypothetical protein
MRYHIPTAFAALILVSAAGAQQVPPIRQLGPVAAKTNQSFVAISSVRALPGGRVLVNDVIGRRVVLLDSSLSNATTVADTTSATSTAYSGRVGGLLAYRGDSTLFVDPQSMSMMVIDPSGKIARVMSVPRSQDAGALSGVAFGAPGFDAKGRLVYRAPNRFMMGAPPSAAGGIPSPPPQPDSAPIVRVDLASRQLDTVGMVKIPKVNFQVTQDERGGIRMTSEVNPLPVVDDWAVLSDGSIAFVRGRDYHVDFVNADGTRSSAAKIPFEWQRLTDEDKVAFIDSVKAQRARMVASAPPGAATGAGNAVTPAGPPGGTGEVRTMMVFGPDGPRAGGPGGPGGPQQPQLNFVAPSELPDYTPPFFVGAVRADAEANLWIRTIPTKAIAGGPVYDVINRRGELVERVQIPQGRTIVGFGPDGAVYLISREGNAAILERARVR